MLGVKTNKMENDVFVLILGANEGAYALAHAFYHDYGIRPTVMDVSAPVFIKDSVALHYEQVAGLEDDRMLLLVIERFYERHSGKSLFLLPVKPCYERVMEANRPFLEKMFFLPHLTRGGASLNGARALLFAYCSTEGQVRTAYAKAAAWDGEGVPTVLLAQAPPGLQTDGLQLGSLSLFAEDANGCLALVKEPLSAVSFFITAADVSLPEWLITDYVLCEDMPAEEHVSGMYSLCPYRLLKHRVVSTMRAEADRRFFRGMATSLFLPKREARRCFLRYARLARAVSKK